LQFSGSIIGSASLTLPGECWRVRPALSSFCAVQRNVYRFATAATEVGVLVKKYGNRRLYDTDQSRYITLEELAESVRQGKEVRVVDAKTGDDLTTATLAQIIVEGRGAGRLLPQALLVSSSAWGTTRWPNSSAST